MRDMMCDEDCGNVVEKDYNTTCDTCLADPSVADYPSVMRWPKPKESQKRTGEDGRTYFTVDMTPHPSIITEYAEAKASDWTPEFQDTAVRMYFLTLMCGLPAEEARKLAEGTHTLHIDEDSDDEVYLLTLVGDEEE